jgi:hypothetical protein
MGPTATVMMILSESTRVMSVILPVVVYQTYTMLKIAFYH